MASYGGRTFTAHGKLHKRNGSSSSGTLQSPPLPPALEGLSSDYKSSGEFKRGANNNTNNVRYTDEQWEIQSQSKNGQGNKIRPYLRKLSSKDDNRIDLSRTTEENNEKMGIAGLGIGSFGVGMGIGSDAALPRSASEVSFNPVGGRTRHGRATSTGSQFSVNSSLGLQKPTAPYAHPMRQTPRPYTPPIAKSYANSLMSAENNASDEPTDLITVDDIRPRFYSESQSQSQSHHRTESVGSLPTHTHPPTLHMHSSSSFTRLNASQSSIPSALPTGGRSRGATLQSIDTLNSPGASSGRPSFDKAVSFLQLNKGRSHGSGSQEEETEASRAASIRALRAQYNEKEQAKEARYEREEMKRAQREEKKRRKSDAAAHETEKAMARRVRSNETTNEKAEFVGKAYDDYTPAHPGSLPRITGHTEKGRPRADTKNSGGSGCGSKSPKSTWVRFLAWLRTRFLRIGA